MSYGPGIGTLIGLAWGERLNDRDYQAERQRLQRAAGDAEAAALVSKAKKDAAKAVLNALVGELSAAQAGQLKGRRFSDPVNLAARNEAFMDTAAGQLRRLSGGKFGFSEASVLCVKRAKVELDQILRDPLLAPKRCKRLGNTG